jgi:hypothetical protein
VKRNLTYVLAICLSISTPVRAEMPMLIANLKAAAEVWKANKQDQPGMMMVIRSHYIGYVLAVVDEFRETGWCKGSGEMDQVILNAVYEASEKAVNADQNPHKIAA